MVTVVTGSSGFIGNFLVRRLQEVGHHVVGLDRNDPSWAVPTEFVRADLLDAPRGEVSDLLARADRVYHLAASKDDWGVSEEQYWADNFEATRRLVQIGRGVGVTDWVFYSTVGVLAPGEEPADEAAPYAPITPYGDSKAAAEQEFLSDEGRDGERVIVVRPSAVYGPGQPPSTNVYRLVEALERRHFVQIGASEDLKTLSYITNLITATMFLTAKVGPGGHVFHYVDEPVLSTKQIVETICRELGRSAPRFRLPEGLALGLASVADVLGDVLHVDFPITADRIRKFCRPTNYAATKIRRLGFEQPVSVETALAKAVAWQSNPGDPEPSPYRATFLPRRVESRPAAGPRPEHS